MDKGQYRLLGLLLVIALLLPGKWLFSKEPDKKSLEAEIQELKDENQKLKQQIDDLNAKIDLLLSRMEKLEKNGAAAKSGAGTAPAIIKEDNLGPTVIKIPTKNSDEPVVRMEVQKNKSPSDPKTMIVIDENKKSDEAKAKTAPPPATPSTQTGKQGKALLDEAKGLMDKKQYAQAEKVLKDRLAQKPAAPEACSILYNLGNCRSLAGKSGDAAAAYKDLATRYPTCDLAPEAMYDEGDIYYKTGNADKGKKVMEELIALYPFSKYANLAESRIKQ
jgi:TolA-binding protein